ncbi:MAG TPA: peptidoglycan-binding domain-containing protein [Burkholderiales bacterium]|nr:peptidoglycan-binding domain-containing protein [Burkholderiales bacterium]
MNFRLISTAIAACALSFSALAQDTAAETTVKLVQEKLHHFGFYSGRIDGDLSGDTQAALTQFQISQQIHASGGLDDETLKALGVQREQDPSAAAGGTALSEASPEQKAD